MPAGQPSFGGPAPVPVTGNPLLAVPVMAVPYGTCALQLRQWRAHEAQDRCCGAGTPRLPHSGRSATSKALIPQVTATSSELGTVGSHCFLTANKAGNALCKPPLGQPRADSPAVGFLGFGNGIVKERIPVQVILLRTKASFVGDIQALVAQERPDLCLGGQRGKTAFALWF